MSDSGHINREALDEENRNKIREQLDNNFLVEAAAGTGKTTSIVGRMVNLIATGKCDIERLVAVTFTRKSAAELRERFGESLRAARQDLERSEDQRQRILAAENAIQLAFVGTIHSFCAMLLKERPVEAGVDPMFRELDTPENMELLNQAWHDFMSDLHASADDRLERIREFGLRPHELQSCFHDFANYPDVEDWPHDPVETLDPSTLRDEVNNILQEIDELRTSFPNDRGTDRVMDKLDEISRKAQHIQWDRMGELFDLCELFLSKYKPVQKWWHDPKVARSFGQRLATFRETIIEPAMQRWYEYRYQFVIALFQEAITHYDRLRKASGGLSFEDLLLHIASALQNQPQLRLYFGRRFTHLLVDEFQDTDPVQASIFAYLTSDDEHEKSWRACTPRPGSLFLVGDPKQSIYRFRRADIVTYRQMKEIFRRSGGEVISLRKSFRAVTELRQWNNQTFDQLLGATETDYSPAAGPMLQGRIDVTTGETSGVKKLTIPAGLNAREALEHEAKTIALYIRGALDSQLEIARSEDELKALGTQIRPSDFLIVTRAKADLPYFANELDRLGIPNEVSGSNAFEAIDELKLLTAVLRVVDDSTNPIPYVALLRGGSLGFSDQDLFEYQQAGGSFNYQWIPDGLRSELKARFEHINSALRKYLGWLRVLPMATAAERIAADLGLFARSAACVSGNVNAGGFFKAIEWIRAESWNFDSARDMISFMESLADGIEAEPCTAIAPKESAVRIMNLHKVKGLEASVVFLAGKCGGKPRDPRFHVDRKAQTLGYLAISRIYSQRGHSRPVAQPSQWPAMLEEARRFQQCEETRLLYVATTRAKVQLVVSQQFSNSGSMKRWGALDDFLADASELEIPPPTIDVVVPKKQEASGQMAFDFPASPEHLWQDLREPSYTVKAAKELALKTSKRPNWTTTGEYGHRWGSAIHELLELRMKNPESDLRWKAVSLAIEHELGSERVDELLSTVVTVVRSDIWQRSLKAKRRFAEIPFDTAVTNDTRLPTMIRGVADLVFEEPDGWVIVDYKTDDVTPDQLTMAVDFYRPQLDMYAQIWTTIGGQHSANQHVKETGLLFTRIDHYAEVSS